MRRFLAFLILATAWTPFAAAASAANHGYGTPVGNITGCPAKALDKSALPLIVILLKHGVPYAWYNVSSDAGTTSYHFDVPVGHYRLISTYTSTSHPLNVKFGGSPRTNLTISCAVQNQWGTSQPTICKTGNYAESIIDDRRVMAHVQENDQEIGVVTKTSPRSVGDTVSRLEEILVSKSVKLFAVIDQSHEAREVGLELRDTTLVIFGSPRAGTPIMSAAPLAALDLPLKLLIWADETGTKVSYYSPSDIAARHHLSLELAQGLAAIDALSDALVAP
jgi:uncharacterized protein (DUF302 family)